MWKIGENGKLWLKYKRDSGGFGWITENELQRAMESFNDASRHREQEQRETGRRREDWDPRGRGGSDRQDGRERENSQDRREGDRSDRWVHERRTHEDERDQQRDDRRNDRRDRQEDDRRERHKDERSKQQEREDQQREKRIWGIFLMELKGWDDEDARLERERPFVAFDGLKTMEEIARFGRREAREKSTKKDTWAICPGCSKEIAGDSDEDGRYRLMKHICDRSANECLYYMDDPERQLHCSTGFWQQVLAVEKVRKRKDREQRDRREGW